MFVAKIRPIHLKPLLMYMADPWSSSYIRIPYRLMLLFDCLFIHSFHDYEVSLERNSHFHLLICHKRLNNNSMKAAHSNCSVSKLISHNLVYLIVLIAQRSCYHIKINGIKHREYF